MNVRWKAPNASDGASRAKPSETIDLRKLVVTLRKRKWTIILVAVFVSAIAAIAASVVAPIYSSSVTILFANSQSATGFETQSFEVKNGNNSGGLNIATQKEILGSRALAERVTLEQDLFSHWEYNSNLEVPKEFKSVSFLPYIRDTSLFSKGESKIEDVSIGSITTRLLSRISVAEPRKTDLLTVTVESADPNLAANIANGYSKALERHYLEQSTTRDSQAKSFLSAKVIELKGKLDTAERQLSNERRRAGLSADGQDSSGDTIALLQNRLVDAKTRLELAKIQWEQVLSASETVVTNVGSNSSSVTFTEQRQTKTLEQTVPFQYIGTKLEYLPIVDGNPLVQTHKSRVQEAQRELEELNNRYGNRHPRVIDARSILATNKNNLDRQIGNVISSIESKYEVVQRQVLSLEADIRREESRQYDRNAGRASIKEIELDRDANKRYYEDALLEYRSYEEKELRTVPMSISDRAVTAEHPVKPNKSFIIILSMLLSTLLTIALIFIYESLKETVQGVQEIERKLGITVFGIIPFIRTGWFGLGNIPLVPGYTGGKKSGFDEAIWTIHTSTTSSETDVDKKVIMITSSIPGEGKSTLALNLAHSMSELEAVVLVEADIRRPGVSKALGLDSLGLSEYLKGEIHLDEAIVEQATGLLDVVPAGGGSNSPGKLLASSEFNDMLDELKQRYQRIILDLAPVQAVSDAIVVGKYVDSAIYVVKADSIPIPIVNRGVERLKNHGIPVDGIVISQVDFNKISVYGGDYYYQGYYDYYGYGDRKR